MRFVIGCSLSLIFSASCAYAQAPAHPDRSSGKARAERRVQADRAEPETDYGPLLMAAIERRGESQAAIVDETPAAENRWTKPAQETTASPDREALITAQANMRPLERVAEILQDLPAETPVQASAEAQPEQEVLFEIDLPQTGGM